MVEVVGCDAAPLSRGIVDPTPGATAGRRTRARIAGCDAAVPLTRVEPPRSPEPVSGPALVTLGSTAEDRLRVAQILGRAPTDGFLIRSASSLTPELMRDSAGPAREVILPELRTVWNSALPFSLNDGAMWAGRGANVQVTGGVRAASGRWALVLTPQAIYQQNREFQIIPGSLAERSPFSSPWHTFPESLDLPLRFGADPILTLRLGQSSVWYDTGPIEIGASTEDQWWGPGTRNAIVLSNNAAGIPHLFFRTSAPVQTRIGALEGRWIAGRLQESEYFDRDLSNDLRAISALGITLTPAIEPNLTIGLARAVYRATDGWLVTPADFARVLSAVGRPNDRPPSDPNRNESRSDQLFSLFGRWIFPDAGFEAYGEWARYEAFSSIRDLLVAPNHSQGYTIGVQWAREAPNEGVVRLQGELTNLEQSSTYRQRRVISYYKSRPVLQGYTQRGQVIGASIGPGASSQWLGADYLAPRWQVGVHAGRIRWENDTYYATQPPFPLDHDVSLFGGVRGGYTFRWGQLDAEWIVGTRLNYLFQNDAIGFADRAGVDIRNHTVKIAITPGNLSW